MVFIGRTEQRQVEPLGHLPQLPEPAATVLELERPAAAAAVVADDRHREFLRRRPTRQAAHLDAAASAERPVRKGQLGKARVAQPLPRPPALGQPIAATSHEVHLIDTRGVGNAEIAEHQRRHGMQGDRLKPLVAHTCPAPHREVLVMDRQVRRHLQAGHGVQLGERQRLPPAGRAQVMAAIAQPLPDTRPDIPGTCPVTSVPRGQNLDQRLSRSPSAPLPRRAKCQGHGSGVLPGGREDEPASVPVKLIDVKTCSSSSCVFGQ